MVRLALLAALIALAAPSSGFAQSTKVAQPNSCDRFSDNRSVGADRDVMYLRAACVAARAGVTSPANGRLDREELMSILMLIGLQRPTNTHSSS
jgi:hypothetical protein